MRARIIAGVVVVAASVLGITASQAWSTTSAHTEHFTGFSDNPNVNGIGTVWATGPVSGRGSDVVIDEHTDRFVFPTGSITVSHHITSQHDNQDAAVCTFTHEEHGVYSVISGTGAYTNAHSSGTYRVDVNAQGCSETQPPTVFTLTLQAVGPMTLG
jgi:hypothetical protein